MATTTTTTAVHPVITAPAPPPPSSSVLLHPTRQRNLSLASGSVSSPTDHHSSDDHLDESDFLALLEYHSITFDEQQWLGSPTLNELPALNSKGQSSVRTPPAPTPESLPPPHPHRLVMSNISSSSSSSTLFATKPATLPYQSPHLIDASLSLSLAAHHPRHYTHPHLHLAPAGRRSDSGVDMSGQPSSAALVHQDLPHLCDVAASAHLVRSLQAQECPELQSSVKHRHHYHHPLPTPPVELCDQENDLNSSVGMINQGHLWDYHHPYQSSYPVQNVLGGRIEEQPLCLPPSAFSASAQDHPWTPAAASSLATPTAALQSDTTLPIPSHLAHDVASATFSANLDAVQTMSVPSACGVATSTPDSVVLAAASLSVVHPDMDVRDPYNFKNAACTEKPSMSGQMGSNKVAAAKPVKKETTAAKALAAAARRKKRNLVCVNCKATDTPLWRRTPDKKEPLCNACGLFIKQHGFHRTIASNGATRRASASRSATYSSEDGPPSVMSFVGSAQQQSHGGFTPIEEGVLSNIIHGAPKEMPFTAAWTDNDRFYPPPPPPPSANRMIMFNTSRPMSAAEQYFMPPSELGVAAGGGYSQGTAVSTQRLPFLSSTTVSNGGIISAANTKLSDVGYLSPAFYQHYQLSAASDQTSHHPSYRQGLARHHQHPSKVMLDGASAAAFVASGVASLGNKAIGAANAMYPPRSALMDMEQHFMQQQHPSTSLPPSPALDQVGDYQHVYDKMMNEATMMHMGLGGGDFVSDMAPFSNNNKGMLDWMANEELNLERWTHVLEADSSSVLF